MAEWNDFNVVDADNTVRFPEDQLPSTVNNGMRADEGILARGLKDTIDGAITTAGTSTAYTVAPNRTLTAYYDGLTVTVEWNATCGATPTVNLDSLGAKNLYFPDGTQVTTGDLISGARSILQYDGTNFQVLTGGSAGVTLDGTQTLTNKTLTSPVLNTAVSGTAVLDEDNMASDSATQLATQQSIKAYVDANVAGAIISPISVVDANFSITDNVDPTKIGKFQMSGITTGTTRTVTFPDADVTIPTTFGDMTAATYDAAGVSEQLVGLTASQTITNKTLTAPIISTISNTGTVTLPTATDTLVGRATTDTLTNKTFDANGTGNSLSNVDVADLADGTDGELITWDAAGAPTTVGAGTLGQVLTSNGAGAAPTFQAASSGETAKGWVAYDQTGTPAILDSFNVTSVSDDGTGLFTVTWETDFASTSYAVVNDGFVTAGTYIWAVTTAVTAGTVSVQCGRHSDNGVLDCDIASVVAFGDQ